MEEMKVGKRVAKYEIKLVRESNSIYNIEKMKIENPNTIYELIKTVYQTEDLAEEMFGIVCLDTKNNVIGTFDVSHGSLDSSIVHPREVFKRALLLNASSIILFHNHPSGNPQPSKEDISITKRLLDSGKILGVKILDHIVIGDYYVSLKELGYI